MTPKDRLALSAYMEMLDDTVDLRNDSISMNGGEPVRLLLADRDELEADRDRLRSELDAARAELARARLAYIRQIERRAAKHCAEWAQVIRSMGCWDPGSYQGRKLTRIRKVRDACRAELARMGAL